MAKKKETPALDLAELQADAQEQQENQAKRFDLADIVKAGEELEELNAVAEKQAKDLQKTNEKIKQLTTETLPDMLKNVGLNDFTLASGVKIVLYDVISASITEDNKEECHAWLRANKHGDLIKNNVIVTFGKGEDDSAKEVMSQLIQARRDGDISFGDLEQKEAVHYSTLQAFVKRQLEAGNEFPGPLFKLYTGHAVKISKK